MDIRGLKLAALRRNIGVVFQEALLFNRSIADNLRVGKPDATEEEMRTRRAARRRWNSSSAASGSSRPMPASAAACCPAASASGCRSHARCLKDPPILILDEATSALDAVTEAKVNAALDEVMKGRTTFVIAHRLSTIRNATRILVFDTGRVIESGTFDELVAQRRPFRGTREGAVHGAGECAGQPARAPEAGIDAVEMEVRRNLAHFVHDLIAPASVLDRQAGIGLRAVATAPDTLETRTSHRQDLLIAQAGLKGPESESAFSSPVASQAVVELDSSSSRRLRSLHCAARRARRSAAAGRSR